MLTQLNVAPSGSVIGMRYESLPFVMRMCEVKRADMPDVMDCLQLMERHMAKLLNKKD